MSVFSIVFGCNTLTEHRQVADILERPRQPQNQTKNHTYDIPPDSAHNMISDSIHSNRKAEHMCTLNEDQDENLSQSEDVSQNRPTNQHTTVSKRLHRGMGQLKFADDPASICGNDAKEKDAEQAWDETEDGEGLGKGENAQRNVLGEHENTSMPPVLSDLRAEWLSGCTYHLHVL
jgi:hypothetical protein